MSSMKTGRIRIPQGSTILIPDDKLTVAVRMTEFTITIILSSIPCPIKMQNHHQQAYRES